MPHPDNFSSQLHARHHGSDATDALMEIAEKRAGEIMLVNRDVRVILTRAYDGVTRAIPDHETACTAKGYDFDDILKTLADMLPHVDEATEAKLAQWLFEQAMSGEV